MLKPEPEDPEARFAVKKDRLKILLREQPCASDLIWSLFRAASESYKFDSLLRPFPKMFLDSTGEKQIDRMRDVASSVPSILETIRQLEADNLPELQIDLLYFVLIQSRSFGLRALKKTDFPQTIEKIQKLSSLTAVPDQIFAVDNSSRASHAKFDSLAKKYGLRYGFHGSRLENFYSILHHGLQVSLNKVAAFGPGVYLSGDISVSMTYSPAGITWSESLFGDRLSAIALCEMIDHPDVRCQDDKLSTRKYAEENRVNEVPHKYFIVQNSDLVRVTHLLVYTLSRSSKGGIAHRLDRFWEYLIGSCIAAYFIFLLLRSIS